MCADALSKATMSSEHSVFQTALSSMLTELFDGPPAGDAYVLNPGDPGLLRQLDAIDATTASKRLATGRPPIAAHVDHVHFGFVLLNRWARGDENPWTGADWNASWRLASVTDEEWRALRDRLRHEVTAWRTVVESRTSWDAVGASAALSTAVHTAYHLGAIRQILAALTPRDA